MNQQLKQITELEIGPKKAIMAKKECEALRKGHHQKLHQLDIGVRL